MTIIVVTVTLAPDTAGCQAYETPAEKGFRDPRDKALASAIHRGDEQEVRRAVSGGGNLNASGERGVTPLEVAMLRRNRRIFQALLDLGANPNFTTAKAAPPIYEAAAFDDPWFLKTLLSHGGKANAVSTARLAETPLFSAIEAHRRENALVLIRAGADVNFMSTAEPRSALMAAVSSGQFDIACDLLEAGADPLLGNRWVLQLLTRQNDLAMNPPADSEQGGHRRRFVELLAAKGLHPESP
jgi:ankyrin repeat protein